jgi:hypothetical protein
MSLSLRKRSQGQTLIEYTLIIPVFLIFICMAFELTFMFISSQRVATLSREMANSGFRDCVGLKPEKFDECRDDVFTHIRMSAQTLLPGFMTMAPSGFPRGIMKLSFFTPPAADPNQRPIRVSQFFPTGVAAGLRVDEDSVWPITRYNTPVVSAEVSYKYQAITPFGKILGILLPKDIELYETTVY